MTVTETSAAAEEVGSSQPHTVSSAVAALAEGTITSVELVQNAIDLADAHDEDLGVFITRFNESALAAAAAVDDARAAGDTVGPLAGIPLGIKDIITTTEAVSTAQSLVLDPEWSDGDAVVVRRLRAAGGVMMGKLSTMEFACGLPDPEKPFPIPRNPWDRETWPGGSSSGTGGGVASGMFLGGLGTDTGGSIRIPAVFCGISGLMPTYGRVPKSGCVPLGYSLDHIGPMARSARDCALMLQVMAGYDSSDATAIDVPVDDYLGALTGDLTGLRIGIDLVSGTETVEPDPALQAAMETAVAVLEAGGATLSTVTLPHHSKAMEILSPLNSGEAGAYHLPDMQTRFGDYVASNRVMFGGNVFYSGADYVQAQRARRIVHRDLMALYDDVDLILTPSAFVGALKHDGLSDNTSWITKVNTPYWDLTGNPVISVPVGYTDGGLPLGMQLAGRPFDESTVLRAADAYQQSTSWHLDQALASTNT